jgi:hypothetical protein
VDLIESLAALEDYDDLHEARILVLLAVFAGRDGQGEIAGLTKLAKLDFLLRYPVLLERALQARGRSTDAIELKSYERDSVESKMVRYRFGPWDPRHRRFVNLLVAKGLARVHMDGRTVMIGATGRGLERGRQLAEDPNFQDVARRAASLRAGLDLAAGKLADFIYKTFPEVVSLRMNEAIGP